MDLEKWKKGLQKAFSREKGLKFAVALGILGIALIFLSSLFSAAKEKKTSEPQGGAASFPQESCERDLEQELSRIVRAITGEEAPEVLVTLESGRKYVYAEDEKTNSREDSGENSGERETAHVILKNSDGGQQALTVTEIEPEIKGVVIVSRYAGDPVIREKLTNAVKTALDISSARVCVTDTG